MKRIVCAIALVLAMAMPATVAAQLNLGRGAKALGSAVKALTLSDADMAQYVKEYIDWMDEHNHVTPADNPYTSVSTPSPRVLPRSKEFP